jgi:hypothetical protein
MEGKRQPVAVQLRQSFGHAHPPQVTCKELYKPRCIRVEGGSLPENYILQGASFSAINPHIAGMPIASLLPQGPCNRSESTV